jgi:hypothetical protein
MREVARSADRGRVGTLGGKKENRIMKRSLVVTFAVTCALALTACQSSSSKDVKSNYRSQWTDVRADVKATTAVAEQVLTEAELKDVKSSSTTVDGSASGKKADGTKVNVAIKKEGDTKSQVSVTVGTMGDPSLGADLAKKIKDRAEMGSSSASTTKPAMK